MEANPDILNELTAYITSKTGTPLDESVGGDPILTKVGTIKAKSGDAYSNLGDVRDSLSALVSSGYSGGTADEKYRPHISKLVSSLGLQQAQSLLTRVVLFNGNPNASAYNPEQRVSRFYDLTPADPEMEKLIYSLKNFSTGILGGLNTTPETVGMEASNRLVVVK
jgi:hypothetical protein